MEFKIKIKTLLFSYERYWKPKKNQGIVEYINKNQRNKMNTVFVVQDYYRIGGCRKDGGGGIPR